MTSIEKIFNDNDFITRNKSPETSITEIENTIDFPLPDDYSNFLLKYELFEGTIGPQYFQLWDIENLIPINNEYSIFSNLDKTLGIGTNLSGELIAIENFGIDQHRIVLTPFIDLSKEYNLTIGDSFTDFLIRLDSGKEWFES